MTTPHDAPRLRHGLLRMTGRDPREGHRAATPLELLFDLTFVVSFGQAGGLLAHAVAENHALVGLGGFAFAMFALCWAWINFSWLASAFDTDDWFYRITTMVQMAGVIILALGLPDMFHSLEEGHHFDNRVMVIGYIVMRVALVTQWLRVAASSPTYRRTALTYAGFVLVAQLGWVVVAFAPLPFGTALAIGAVLFLVEMGGPVVAERSKTPTPWHPHHIAERYALLAIIAMGEVLFGTVSTVSEILAGGHGWSSDAVFTTVAGVGLVFGLWWIYFMVPAAHALERHPERSFGWGYLHMVLFASIAAVGAGIHVLGYVIEGTAHITPTGAVLSVAIPVAVFVVALFGIHSLLLRSFDAFHLLLMIGVLVLLAVAVLIVGSGGSFGIALLVTAVAPAVVVIGYETIGHRHLQNVLDRF